jgi:hypothetical protein
MDFTLLSPLIQHFQSYKIAIFTGSITLGTFLFTMNTFIIQTMKREVYDKEEYQQSIAARRKEGLTKESFYGQLLNLKHLLFLTIADAFVNAVVQITVGYYETLLSAAICFLSTGILICLTITALILVSVNLSRMIAISERAAEEKFNLINNNQK